MALPRSCVDAGANLLHDDVPGALFWVGEVPQRRVEGRGDGTNVEVIPRVTSKATTRHWDHSPLYTNRYVGEHLPAELWRAKSQTDFTYCGLVYFRMD